MREDLPCDDPQPRLWCITLDAAGDLVEEAPEEEGGVGTPSRSSLYEIVGEVTPPVMQSSFPTRNTTHHPHCRSWRVQRKDDGVRNVLQELRLDVPECRAAPQLGRLRELMLREARLLDSLHHECIMPLECGWLEQRTGERQDYHGLSPLHTLVNPILQTRPSWASGAGATGTALPTEVTPGEAGGDVNGDDGRLPARASREGLVDSSRSCSAEEHMTCPEATAQFPVAHAHSGDTAALLHSCVPWIASDEDDSTSDSENDQEDAVGKTCGGAGDNGGGKQQEQQPRWGGDQSTDWSGTAEPKMLEVAPTFPTHRAKQFSTVEDLLRGSRPGARTSTFEGRQRQGENGICSGDADYLCMASQMRMLCLASYLLMPDSMPLRAWLEIEFEPRIECATPPDVNDEQGCLMAVTRAVTTPEDWSQVWGQLLAMFLQVVRGVEYLHEQGIVHNNISTSSVWVAPDGRCCLGNMAYASPPGRRRPPPHPATSPLQHPFASPELQRGSRLDSHSDVYSLGVLLLEFWRRFRFARGLSGFGSTTTGVNGGVTPVDLLGTLISSREMEEQTIEGVQTWGMLDIELLRGMLAADPLDRPDCFTIVDELARYR